MDLWANSALTDYGAHTSMVSVVASIIASTIVIMTKSLSVICSTHMIEPDVFWLVVGPRHSGREVERLLRAVRLDGLMRNSRS